MTSQETPYRRIQGAYIPYILEVRRLSEDQIARKLLKYKAMHEGITLSTGNARQLGSVAKDLGIPMEELQNFIRPLLHEIVDELFIPKKKES